MGKEVRQQLTAQTIHSNLFFFFFLLHETITMCSGEMRPRKISKFLSMSKSLIWLTSLCHLSFNHLLPFKVKKKNIEFPAIFFSKFNTSLVPRFPLWIHLLSHSVLWWSRVSCLSHEHHDRLQCSSWGLLLTVVQHWITTRKREKALWVIFEQSYMTVLIWKMITSETNKLMSRWLSKEKSISWDWE